MARAKTVWGIDIGQCALKALKLRDAGGQLEVEEFEVLLHPRILSEPEVDRDQLIRDALQRFLASHSVAGSQVVISVPGQASFSRFVKLPPVEAKRVPDIVRFEAEQQIPFPINEVIWRYQTFRDPDSPDVEVGIFAMKRSDVAEMLHHFNEVALPVDVVQVAPLSLYNFMMHDEQFDGDGATILADVGADKTDLVIADKGRLWTRTIQIGGNNFTEALVRTFKLSFDKAEELKLSAASSKYARQIFQAMRPVFADLVQEIQRSIGFYTSLHRETRFKKLVGLGNGFRLPGLQKFIEQNLNVSVARVDAFNKLTLSPSVNAPVFHENVPALAVSYGLAIQGLGKQRVSTNLLPEEIVRFRLWKKKRPYFVGAAVVLLAAMFCPGYRANSDSAVLRNRTDLDAAGVAVEKIEATMKQWRDVSGKDVMQEQAMRQRAALLDHRNFWPSMMAVVEESVRSVTPDQPMLMNYARLLEYREYVNPVVREQILTGRGLSDPNRLDEAASMLLDGRELRGFRGQFQTANTAELRNLGKGMLGKVRLDANSAALNATGLQAMEGAALKLQVMRLMLLQRIQQAEAFKAKPRKERQVIIVEAMDAAYSTDIGGAAITGGCAPTETVKAATGKAGFKVTFGARTPREQAKTNTMVAELCQYSKQYCQWFSAMRVLGERVELLPNVAPVGGIKMTGGGPAGPVRPDPLMPDEESANDTQFKIVWFVEVRDEGIVLDDVKAEAGGNRYVLGKGTEMFPNFDTSDALADVRRIAKLPAGTNLAVDEIRVKMTVPWYRVKASDAGGKSLGIGWICGAEVNQQLKPVR
jgi:type IV pilus assembly protein PilM